MKKVPVVEVGRGDQSEFTINITHALPYGPSKDQKPHGHDFTLIVYVEGSVDPKTGFVMEMGELKDIIKREIVEVLDHQDANQVLNHPNPTLEVIVLWMWEKLKPLVPKLSKLELWETSKIRAYCREKEVESESE